MKKFLFFLIEDFERKLYVENSFYLKNLIKLLGFLFDLFHLIKNWRFIINFRDPVTFIVKNNDNFISILLIQMETNAYHILRTEYLKVITNFITKKEGLIIFTRFLDDFIGIFICLFMCKFLNINLFNNNYLSSDKKLFFEGFLNELSTFHFKVCFGLFLTLKLDFEFDVFLKKCDKKIVFDDKYMDINSQFFKNGNKALKRVEKKFMKIWNIEIKQIDKKCLKAYELDYEIICLKYKHFKRRNKAVDFIEKKLLNIRNQKIKLRNQKIKLRNQDNLDIEFDESMFSDLPEDDEISD